MANIFSPKVITIAVLAQHVLLGTSAATLRREL